MFRILSLTLTAGLAVSLAQDAVVSNLKTLMSGYRQNEVEGAGKMAESDFDFKPSSDVMSFRELVGHLADTNFGMCAQLVGEKNPDAGGNAKRNAEKAALVSALDKSFEYCAASFGKLKDADLATKYRAGANERDKAWLALHILEHNGLHYGNMITYMRIKGHVPPETERRSRAQKK